MKSGEIHSAPFHNRVSPVHGKKGTTIAILSQSGLVILLVQTHRRSYHQHSPNLIQHSRLKWL